MTPLAGVVDPAPTGPGTDDSGIGATTSATRTRWLNCVGNTSRLVMRVPDIH